MSVSKLSPDEIVLAHKSGIISDHELVLLVNTIERERCKTDLYFLAHDVLGYSDLTSAMHRPLCQLVESVNPLIIELRNKAALKVVTTSATHTATTSSGHSLTRKNPLEAHADHMAQWLGFAQRKTIENESQLDNAGVNSPDNSENDFGGRGEGEGRSLIPKQNFIKKFELPKTDTINGLISKKIIEWHPEAHTRLFLLFRGAFKSTIITIAHTIQLMLLWPDIRILIASHKKEGGSQKFLGSIKDHFIRNERFRALFPEYCPKPNSSGQMDWGTSEMVTLPNRKGIYPEATIEIAGNTTDVTGRHYNYLKIDDIVTRESVTNESMLAKTEEFNALLKFLFDQPEWGLSDYAGTCYHFADLYNTLRNSDQITKFILPVWDEQKIPTIPERFTQEGIERLRNDPSMTSYQFSAQYLMNPVPQEDQVFRPEYWNKAGFYYEKLPKDLKMYVLVDPANTQRKESDYTALMTIGIDASGDLWFIDIIRDKLTLDGRAKLVLDMLMKHGIHTVHYESIGFQSSDAKSIKEMGQQRDWYVSVVEVKASRQSKEDRIRGLQYYFEQGKVHWPRAYKYFSKYHNREFNMVDVFRQELWMFPSCEKDDLADCASFILRTSMLKSSVAKPSEAAPDAMAFFKQVIKDARTPKRGRSISGNNKGNYEIPSQKSWR